MKFLIVNAYSEPYINIYKGYEKIIKNIILNQKEFLDTETEIYYRTRYNLDDCLYEIDSSYAAKKGAINFDNFDMIFIEGDANIKPWSNQAHKINVLLRMCLNTKKIVFASSGMFQCLIYICATNFERKINIKNGDNGSDISILQKFPLVAEENNEYFLDNVTGDLYQYDKGKNAWMPKANTGLHYNKAAEKQNDIGKHMIKIPIFKSSRQNNEKQDAYLQKLTETICRIKKLYLSNYLFENISNFQFTVPSKNYWDCHPFNFKNPNKTFTILADSDKGPLIIQLGDNIISTQFNITKAYEETQKIIQNFIYKKLKDICGFQIKIPVEKATLYLKNSWKPNKNQIKLHESRDDGANKQFEKLYANPKFMQIRPLSSKKIQHSGICCKKLERTLGIIDNNSVHQKKIEVDLDKFNRNSEYYKQKYASLSHTKTFYQSSNQNLSENYNNENQKGSSELYLNSQDPKYIKNLKEAAIMNRVQSNGSFASYQSITQKQSSTLHQKLSQYKEYLQKKNQEDSQNQNFKKNYSENLFLVDAKKQFSHFDKTKKEVRKMLHPNYQKDNLPKNEKQWVPGMLSQRKIAFNQNTVNQSKKNPQKQYFKSSFLKYTIEEIDEARTKPCIRNSSDYVTELEVKRREQKRAALKNLAGPNFKSGKVDENFIPNYVVRDYSEPPLNHRFREVSREKWVGPHFRIW